MKDGVDHAEAPRAAGGRNTVANIVGASIALIHASEHPVAKLVLLAGRRMQARDWAGAITIYEDLRRRIGNNDATILNNLAWAYAQKGDYRRAIPMARHAWELDPNNPVTSDTYGWLLYKSGRDKALAMTLIGQAARGAPSDLDFRALLSREG